jgi:hypothetical protein
VGWPPRPSYSRISHSIFSHLKPIHYA